MSALRYYATMTFLSLVGLGAIATVVTLKMMQDDDDESLGNSTLANISA